MEGNGIICKLDERKLGNKVFEFFIEALNKLENKKIIYVGLSGGRSFNDFYSVFLERKKEINCYGKLRFCFVDERVVPLDSEDSNYKLVNDLLFSKLIEHKLITYDQIITLNLSSENIAKEYFMRVSQIDIGFFGSGEDGHIASLFPESKQLHSKEDEYIFISDSPKLPKKRITLTPFMINRITYSCLVFKGVGKQKPFDNFRNEKIPSSKCPAKLIMNSMNWIAFSDLE